MLRRYNYEDIADILLDRLMINGERERLRQKWRMRTKRQADRETENGRGKIIQEIKFDCFAHLSTVNFFGTMSPVGGGAGYSMDAPPPPLH